MVKLGNRPRRFFILACALLLLRLSNAQGDSQAAILAPPSGAKDTPAVPSTGSVLGHGPYYIPQNDEHPHWHRGQHKYDDYHRSIGPDSGPDSGPAYVSDRCPSCTGRIVAVWCWEDSTGRLQDIAYLNSESPNSIATYLGCSGTTTPTTTPTKTLTLKADESIVWIETCGGKRGWDLESVSFVTDKRTRLTCGRRKSHYESAEALSGPQDVVVAGSSDLEAGQQNENSTTAEGIVPQSVQGKHHRYGHYKHGHDKDEHKSSYGKPDYGQPGYGESDYGKPGYGKSDHEYFPHHPDGGHKCNAVDSRHACWGHRGHTSRTFPLAGFDVTCTANKYVEAITDLCYNTNYTGPPPIPANSLAVLMQINLGDANSRPCPTTPAEWAKLDADLKLLSLQLSQASAVNIPPLTPRVTAIQWSQYDPSMCSSGATQGLEDSPTVRSLLQTQNTTIEITAYIIANTPPFTVEEVRAWLASFIPPDLCTISGNGVVVCSNTGFVTVPYWLPPALAAQAFVSGEALLAGKVP